MKRLLVILFCITAIFTFGQEKKIDLLEMYYDQGHYKMVYRKSKRLLNKPYYDYSALPDFYAAISLYQLKKDAKTYREEQKAFDEAEAHFTRFLEEDVNGKAYQMHIHEILDIQYLLAQKSLSLKNQNRNDEAAYFDGLIKRLFKDGFSAEQIATSRPAEKEPENEKETDETHKETNSKDIRSQVITYAEEFLGVPYKYGSQDPKKGFDCSGYTSFVLEKYDYYISRSSKDQYSSVDKIKRSKVKKGDLIFFGNPKIHHVGMVHEVLENGEITMIHASSSMGISIVNVDQSTYWNPRIIGYGRVIKD